MNALPVSPLLLCSTALAIAVAALLWAEARRSRAGIWLTKPVASTLFIVAAVLAGAPASAYGRLVLLGLLLSWLGDVLLVPRGRLFFMAGLGSFLLAHVAYSSAFVLQPLAPLPLALTAIAMLVFAAVVLRWLWPHLTGPFRPAVVSYLVAICLMVIFASAAVTSAGLLLAAAAVLFAVSDLFVARDRFVTPSIANRLWGLPLYYAAQLAFALSTQAHYWQTT